MDGDGDIDVLSTSQDGNRVALHENDGSQLFSTHIVDSDARGALAVFAADVDGDGDTDVLSASVDAQKIAWYEHVDIVYDFSAPDFSVSEAHEITNLVTLERVGAIDVPESVDVVLTAGSASAGDDFATELVTVDFAAGATEASVPIELLDDLAVESNETIQLSLANFSVRGDTGVIHPTATLIIVDDDPGDFADAPLPYPTQLSEDGARHAAMGAMLGASRDSETDGAHSNGADGDGSDEDGIAFGRIRVGALHAEVSVSVQGGSGRLDAWIDFNQDGSWGGPGEHVFASVDVSAGNNNLTFDVPSWALSGDTFARFRLSTAGGLGIGGAAADGEVEDYPVTLLPPLSADVLVGPLGTDSPPRGYSYVFAVDVDGDGDMDAVSGSRTMPGQWHENDGHERFTTHKIGTSTFEIESLVLVTVDVDSDGDPDVVASDFRKLVWYENDGQGVFRTHIISSGGQSVHYLAAADLESDGDMDLFSVSRHSGKIIWYENDGQQVFTERAIETGASRLNGVATADVDGDSDIDLLTASVEDDQVAWYENNGDRTFTTHTIATDATDVRRVSAADLDSDGDTDVLAGGVGWYENDGTENFLLRRISGVGENAMFAVDVNGDGFTDLLETSINGTRWHENDGTEKFTSHLIGDSAFTVFPADIDGDGDLDVFHGGVDGLTWHENVVYGITLSHSHVVVDEYGLADSFGVRLTAAPSDAVVVDLFNPSVNEVLSDVSSLTFTPTNWDVLQSVTLTGQDDSITDGSQQVILTLSIADTAAAAEFAGAAATIAVTNVDNEAIDAGDAPSPYPTLIADGNAYHAAVGPTLGNERDTELDGAPSVLADGDDLLSSPDEDGVTFGLLAVGALGAEAIVKIHGGPARLDGWIDFNGDGSWGGPAEQVFDNIEVVTGDNVLSFDVPSWAAEGNTYARFRLSTLGDLGVLGPAVDGELEDYQVVIASPARASGVFGERTLIGGELDSPRGVFAVDLDADHDTDILVAALSDDTIAWYENDSNEGFSLHTISTVEDGATSVFGADVDGDGDIDVLSASSFDDTIAWHENDGNEVFTRHAITTDADLVRSVFAADMDADGDMDVLSASTADDRVAWYENDGDENFTVHTITANDNGVHSVFAADLDSDGDMDVLSASSHDGEIAWYENDGRGVFARRTISVDATGASSVFAADVDGDGDMDVLSASYFDDKIAWYENVGNHTFTPHDINMPDLDGDSRNSMNGDVDGARSLFAADLDGDGDTDVLSAAERGNQIAWHENDGSESFRTRTIAVGVDDAFGVFPADVDGDGDLDVLSVSSFDDDVIWHEHIDALYDFVSPTFVATEGDDANLTDVVMITRSGGAGAESVDVFLNDGTATSGNDFTAGPVTVNFDVGELTKSVPIELLGDLRAETTEEFTLSMANFSHGGARGLTQSQATFTVFDDDLDYGDAPVPYPALLAEDGARHGATGPSLGATREKDADGTHSDAADGDGAEEDGVTFGSLQVGSLTATAMVEVHGGPAKLDAWIDFNADGSWGGPGEQVFDNLQLASGDNELDFAIPSWAAIGDTYARFRLSSEGDLGVGGAAADGEVEDYLVNLLPPAAASGEFSRQHTISTDARGARSVFAADVDGDGDMDVLSASHYDSKIAWYENDGTTTLIPHTISTSGGQAIRVFAEDVDGDGDTDVVAATETQIGWYENDGTESFTDHLISDSIRFAESVFVADIDGNGHPDVLAASSRDDSVFLYENDGEGGFTRNTIANNVDMAYGVVAVDVDGDGDMDLVVASAGDDEIGWYENDGSQEFAARTIGRASGVRGVFTIDLDQDGDTDILAASKQDNRIRWFENDGTETFSTHVISSIANAAVSVFAADIDGDGDMDVLSASAGDDKIAWYENDGSEEFTLHDITTEADSAYSVFAADVDGDGDIDVLSASRFDDSITWYENVNSVYDFAAATFNAPESDVSHVSNAVTLTRSGATNIATSVDVLLTEDTATNGDDFTGGSITVNFDVGETSQPVPIELLGDVVPEPSEDFGLSLSNFSHDGAVGETQPTASFTIIDDDFDFGDAPSPYPATIAEGGAGHGAVGPTLGATRDGETDGTHSLAADADGVDEDGVTFSTIQVGALDVEVTVNVQGGAAKLDAWVDFNADGSWGGPGEQIFDSVDVSVGDNTLHFNVPTWAIDGTTYARFRLSTTGSLGVGGTSTVGEVEDYRVTILAPAAASGIFQSLSVIDMSGLGPRSVFVADVDGDGDTDVLSASYDNDTLAWHENDGSGVFTRHNITQEADGADSVFAVDVDGDGDTDVLSASFENDTIAWHENDGAASFTTHTITTAANGARDVSAADVDGDGDMDVLSASRFDDTIAWYENDGGAQFTERTISSVANGATSVSAADIDGDGDMDVLSTSEFDTKIAWYENDGTNAFSRQTISPTAEEASDAVAVDLDGDGDTDVLGVSVDAVVWYENDGSENFAAHMIGTDVASALSVYAVDVDGDGDTDVLSALYADDKITWYENDGSESFTPRAISTSADGARGVFAADVDGDGDMDVLAASSNDNTVAWYENIDTAYDFSAPAFRDDEGDAPNTSNAAMVIRSGATDVSSSVDVVLTDGTASSGEDFTDGDITVNFEAGETIKPVPIELLGDSILGPAREFGLSLSNFSEQTTLGVDQPLATFTITDDDPGDYGDAPRPYPTTLAEDGARHGATGLTLGSTRDTEPDGTPTLTADGDGDDEDGVAFGLVRVGALDAEVTVNVQGAAGKLDAWVDFNADGSWGGVGEQIFDSVDVAVGDNVLSFDVPSWAASRGTYARFRLSSAGNLGYVGAADDGEVEDHRITIRAPSAAAGLFQIRHEITRDASSAFDVSGVDIDGDGDMDILGASLADDRIAWYENDGQQGFTRHTITTDHPGSYSAVATDIDGDGDLDVVTENFDESEVAWYENDGSQNFTRQVIGPTGDLGTVFAADIEGDGDIDVLSTASGRDQLLWFENDGTGLFASHTISMEVDRSASTFVADIDGDGDSDVLGNDGDAILWFENDGMQVFARRIVSDQADGPQSIFAADLDDDGDLDVLSASSSDDRIAWYENDGDENFSQHTITTKADAAIDVFVADLDGDGDFDVLSASLLDDRIAWYENDGDENFTSHTIGPFFFGVSHASSVFAADVDGDGDLDVLGTGRNSDTISWYENKGFDFGDAPDPYPTTLANDGARHGVGFLVLGSSIDEDQDGQPDEAAGQGDTGGDDNDGIDDEDGVQFLTTLVTSGTSSSLVVSTPGILNAWIDVNHDNDWDDPGEHVLTDEQLTNFGANLVSFSIPAGVPGDTVARFRLSSSGGLSSTGAARDGEVEDYVVRLFDQSVDNIPLAIVSPGQGELTVTVDGDDIVAQHGTTQLFRGPESLIGSLHFTGTDGDDSFDIGDFSGPVAGDAGDGADTLLLGGSGQHLDLTNIPAADLQGFETIDISGSGSNTLTLDATDVTDLSTSTNTLRVLHNNDDAVVYVGEWQVQSPEIRDNRYVHLLTQGAATLEVGNLLFWQNPFNPLDANRDGSVSPLDALVTINTLSDLGSRSLKVGTPHADFLYYDSTGDAAVSPLDALVIINLLNGSVVDSEGESPVNAVSQPVHNSRRTNKSEPTPLWGKQLNVVQEDWIFVQANEIKGEAVRWTSPSANDDDLADLVDLGNIDRLFADEVSDLLQLGGDAGKSQRPNP